MKKKTWLTIAIILCIIIGYLIYNLVYITPYEETTVDQFINKIKNQENENINENKTAISSLSTGEKTEIASDKSLSFVQLPEWFVIQEYASVDNARSLAIYEWTNKNIVFVGNKDKNSVYAVIDSDKNKRWDEIIELAKWLTMPNGIVFDGKDLYVAEETGIIVFYDIVEQISTKWSYSYTIFVDGFATQWFAKHGRKYLAQWPDWYLYLSIWSPCNVCETNWNQWTIIKINKETKEQTIIATWIRNSVWFDRDPDSWDMWFTDNGRDLLGNDMPQDELNHLSAIWDDFGFPYCHAWDIQDPKYDSKACSEFVAPFAKLGPHVAALWMKFYTWSSFPASYKDMIFIAEHWSWNRTVPIGYRISMVNKKTWEYQVFADGWLQSNGKKLWRPVDIKQFSDGSLLVSDDQSGKLYRISYEK